MRLAHDPHERSFGEQRCSQNMPWLTLACHCSHVHVRQVLESLRDADHDQGCGTTCFASDQHVAGIAGPHMSAWTSSVNNCRGFRKGSTVVPASSA